MKKIFYLFGILSPILYASAVVAGDILWPSYNQMRQPISELTADFAPKMPLVSALFNFANLCGFLFGLGLLLNSKKRSKSFKIISLLLTIAGVASLSFVFFPQDPIGAPLTFKGLVHLVLAGLASMLTIAVVFTGAYAFQSLAKMKKFSLIVGWIIVISGILTAISTTQFPSIFGIMERITIGTYMVWLPILAFTLFKTNYDKLNCQKITKQS